MRRLHCILALSSLVGSGLASTSIDSVNRYAYAANVGWLNAAGDNSNGAVIGQYYCSGSIYSANVGWISLGAGSPLNGLQYQNASAADYGVNADNLGNLRGYAYGANIGWINFESTGAPQVNLLTGQLSGSVWSANCGWISLSNAVAYVQTDTLSPGLLDTNGLPVAWELYYFGTTNINPNADPDNDGMSNYQEYLAGTDPVSGSDSLKFVAARPSSGSTVTLTWNSKPTRYYHIQQTLSLSPANWLDSRLGQVTPSAGTTTSVSVAQTNAPALFYRVQAYPALPP